MAISVNDGLTKGKQGESDKNSKIETNRRFKGVTSGKNGNKKWLHTLKFGKKMSSTVFKVMNSPKMGEQKLQQAGDRISYSSISPTRGNSKYQKVATLELKWQTRKRSSGEM